MNRILYILIFGIIFITSASAQFSQHYTYEQALAADNVRSIAVADNGDVWIGTTQGITSFDGTTFTSYTTADGLGANLIYDIYVDNSNNVWAATSGGLSVFNGLDWVNYGLGAGMPSNTIWTVSGDENDVIWFGTSDAGIGSKDGATINVYEAGNGLISNSVKKVFVDRSGNVWAGTGSGLSMFNGTDWTSFTQAEGLGGNLINDIIQLSNGNICVGSNGGLSIYNYFAWETITTANGLPNNNILSVVEDNNQILLLGTSNGLVQYVNDSDISLYNYNSGLTANIANVLALDHQGSIWVGSPFTGITYYDRNETFIIYRDNKDLLNDDVNVIYTNIDEELWVGSNGGLNRVEGLHWRSWDETDGLVSDTVVAIFKDEFGKIWTGTPYGLSVLDGSTITNITIAQGLTNNDVRGITGNLSGDVFIATADKVTVIATDGMEVIDTISIEDGLVSNDINNTLYDTNDDRLWILNGNNIHYLESSVMTNMNPFISCVPINPKAICFHPVQGVYVGSEQYFMYFIDGMNTPVCNYNAMFPGSGNISSFFCGAGGILASYINGSVYSYLGSWVDASLAFNVSYINTNSYQYTWYGLQTEGLLKVCNECNETLTFSMNPPVCLGENTGMINISNPVYSGVEYSITYGETWQTSPNFAGLESGYYTVIARDGVSYIADSTFYLPGGYEIEGVLTISQIDCNADNNGSLELSGIGLDNYIWENGNTTIVLRENLEPSVYGVTISQGTCSLELENEIIEPDVIEVFENQDNVLCYGDNTGMAEIDITGGTAPYTILWSGGSDNEIIENLVAGNYAYTVTDAKMCSATGSISISQPSDALNIVGNIDDLQCYGEVGCINVDISGGTPDYSFLWSNESTDEDLCDLPAGTYTLEVTDENECVVEETFVIEQPDNPLSIDDVDIENVLCYGEETGTIDITIGGGTPNYNYQWFFDGELYSNDEDIENLAAGTYSVTISDDNSCSISTSYTITTPVALSLNIDQTPITCPGYNDAVLYADVSGGSGIFSSFLWYNEDDIVVGVSQEFEDVAPGEYTVVVTDSYYCTISESVVVVEASGSEITANVSDATCFGAANGSIQVLIDGGTPGGASYDWQDNIAGNEALADNLIAGNYSVTVTDPAGCVNVFEEEVNQPAMADLNAFPVSGEIRFCSGDSYVLNAGLGFVSYVWSSGQTGVSEISVATEDTYSVIVEDNSGCLLGDTATVIIGEVFQDNELSLVSLDANNNPVLYWNKNENVGTEYYNVYRENDAMEWELIGNSPIAQAAIFTDNNVDGSESPFSYVITAVDTCGNESDYSDQHTSIYLSVQANQYGACTLDWTTYEGFFVVYYFLYRGETEDNLVLIDSTLFSNPHFAEMNPYEDGGYYQVKVRRLDGCEPGDGNYYYEAYSNVVFCENHVGIANSFINSFNVYPMPFDNKFRIEFDIIKQGEMDLSVFNTIGQKVAQLDNAHVNSGMFSNEYFIDVPPGVYILKCRMGENTQNIRLIKQ